MTTIVVADTDFGDSSFEQAMIEKEGISFRGYSGDEARKPSTLIEHLQGADGAITSYGQFTAEVLQALPQLKVVSKTGTGVDNIDVAAATVNATAVCNVPDYGTEAVSDHTIALAMAVLRRINEVDADMRCGVWDYRRRRPLGQISGRTFGVVGLGHIGRAVARKARGLGFHVVAWDRRGVKGNLSPEGIPFTSLEDLLRQADVVSFHTALVPETHHLLNAERLALMKSDAIVINTSRGGVVDTVALAQALTDGKLWGVGLDVFEEEPLLPNHPILAAPHTVLTSHCAYWSEASGVDLRTRCTQAAIDVVLGHQPESCLNPQVLPTAFAK